MPKRQEKPYSARVAVMSNKKLVEEMAKLLIEGSIGGTSPKLDACINEDNTSRGGTCYRQAVKKFNAYHGYREVGPNTLDCREAS